jgi:hypothetical protein
MGCAINWEATKSGSDHYLGRETVQDCCLLLVQIHLCKTLRGDGEINIFNDYLACGVPIIYPDGNIFRKNVLRQQQRNALLSATMRSMKDRSIVFPSFVRLR